MERVWAELISSVSTWILCMCIFATPNAGSRGCLPGGLSPHPIIEGCSRQPLAFKVLQAGTRHSLYVHVFMHAPNTWWHLVSLKCSSRCLAPAQHFVPGASLGRPHQQEPARECGVSLPSCRSLIPSMSGLDLFSLDLMGKSHPEPKDLPPPGSWLIVSPPHWTPILSPYNPDRSYRREDCRSPGESFGSSLALDVGLFHVYCFQLWGFGQHSKPTGKALNHILFYWI